MSEQKTADETVRGLRYQCQKHKNDVVHTGGLNISEMARDAADRIEQQQARIVKLEQQLDESQHREQAAVEDIEKMMRICEKGSCHFCANGDCAESPYCSPKWRGPQEAGKRETE